MTRFCLSSALAVLSLSVITSISAEVVGSAQVKSNSSSNAASVQCMSAILSV